LIFDEFNRQLKLYIETYSPNIHVIYLDDVIFSLYCFDDNVKTLNPYVENREYEKFNKEHLNEDN